MQIPNILPIVGLGDNRISTVLSERLRKLTDYGLLSKHVYAEVPPRTEYALSQNGQKLVNIIEHIRGLDDEIRIAE
ncbi:hypothetical protein BH20PSE1_BH20PSE1_02690 [soil metagenome]